MIVFPNAKINLGLRVVARRDDGFHNLESIFLPVGWSDVLEVITAKDKPNGTCTFSSSGLEIPGNAEQNLVVRAYQMLHERLNLPAIQVHLHKNIPMGAGLGGGSADGAFMLQALNELFVLNLGQETLEADAATLGSDCPFFIRNTPQKVSGRGEFMQPIDFPLENLWIHIIWPGIHVPTKVAFSGIEPQMPEVTLGEMDMNSLPENWKSIFQNDFAKPIGTAYPAIAELEAKMYGYGALYAQMTGTGSAVYGIFSKETRIPISPFDNHVLSWSGKL